jgi:hypothetical protein
MYRERWHFHPKTYADWDKVLAVASEFEKLAATKGWAPGTFWSHTVGETPTEIIGEWDYPDMAAYQREYEEYECPEMAEIFAKLDEVEGTRPVYKELLQEQTV